MCGTATWWAKLALLCVFLAVPLHIGGWASDNWMTYENDANVVDVDVGLWQQTNSTNGTSKTTGVDGSYETAEFDVVRGLETVVTLLAILAFILLIIYVCVENARVVNSALAIMIICYVAGLASVVGAIVWLVSVPDPFVSSFSLGLTVIASILLLLAATLLIPELLEPQYALPETRRSVSPYGGTPPRYHQDRRNTVVTPMSWRHRGSESYNFRF